MAVDDVTFPGCPSAEAVRIGLAAAGGKNLEAFSPTTSSGRQLLELELIYDIYLSIVPVLLGDGIRLYDNPGRQAGPPPPGRRWRSQRRP